MKKIIIILLLTIASNSFAQILKENKFLLPDSSTLYYLTARDKFNGIYTIKKNDQEIARGNYVDDKRVGNWYFFNADKSLSLRYNYDNKKILFVDNKTLALATVKIKAENNELAKNANISMPIFSLQQYFIIMIEIAKKAVPQEHKKLINNKDVTITANVDKNANAVYVLKYNVKGKQFEKQLNINNGPFNIDWIAANSNGTSYDSEFSFTTSFDFSKTDEGLHRRFNWLK